MAPEENLGIWRRNEGINAKKKNGKNQTIYTLSLTNKQKMLLKEIKDTNI